MVLLAYRSSSSSLQKGAFVDDTLVLAHYIVLYPGVHRSPNTRHYLQKRTLHFHALPQSQLDDGVASKRIARPHPCEKTKAQSLTKGSKNVHCVLFRSNLAEIPKKALDEDEVSSQMA